MVMPQSDGRWRRSSDAAVGVYTITSSVYTPCMSKRLVEIDDAVLEAARAELGTATIKATVNEALRRAVAGRAAAVHDALARLAAAQLSERDDAWR
jgi:Arc/MetJ family transcription regulator